MPPENLIVRSATSADLDAMVELLNALFSLEADFNPDPERQRRGLQLFMEEGGAHRYLFVVEEVTAGEVTAGEVTACGGQVIAMASIQVLISTAEGGPVGLVEDVVVREDRRSRGIGRRLMADLFTWADRHGLTRLQLLADGNNSAARAFYEALGWQTTRLICLRHH